MLSWHWCTAAAGGIRTHDLAVASPAPYRYKLLRNKPINEFAGTGAVHLLLTGVHIKHVVECKCLVLADHNLLLAWRHTRTYAAHFNSLTCQLWSDSVAQYIKTHTHTP